MKREPILIVLIVGIIIGCSAFCKKRASDQLPANAKGFAVIELFSSEGCSSCPPAEAVMNKLISKASTESLPVYIIEFHVDYWDYLGWKDTFAIPQYSQRQQDYGDYFKLNSIGTFHVVSIE